MIRKILGLVVLISVMTVALIFYSLNASVPDVPGEMTGYKQKLIAKTKEIAGPVLKKAGFDIESTNAGDFNVVEQQLDNASNRVNQAADALTQTQ